ncbi:MAG: hypothetical protein E2O29_01970 [Deltaproteobacteria bacterium]|nr:MAG: hypothetical protein E2O29_01970 [Deltaproteobacteria bacterium]
MGETVFGVNIKSEAEQRSRQRSGPLKVTLTIENIKETKEIEKSIKRFSKYNLELYRNLVFEIHKYLIRVTPMDTGKLRGGWTAILDKYTIDYSRQIKDTSLYDPFKKSNKTPYHKEYHFSASSVAEGKASSVAEDKTPAVQEIAVDNQVPYKDAMDFGKGVHFTTRARYAGELWFTKFYGEWLKKMEKEGKVVRPPKVTEIDI